MNERELQNDAEWSEVVFSYLTTGWYDWAVANFLSRNGTHCWSTTSAYYATYILAAFGVIAWPEHYASNKGNLIQIVEHHRDLVQFYEGGILYRNNDQMGTFRDQFIQHISETMGIHIDEAQNLITTIGNFLSHAKKARESHNYHVLVVSHQMMNSVRTPKATYKINENVHEINQNLLDIIPELNLFSTNLMKRVINKRPSQLSILHYRHLLDELNEFENLVTLEGLLPLPENLETTIEQLRTEASEITKGKINKESWNTFQNYFTQIDIKVRNYGELPISNMKISNDLKQLQKYRQLYR